VTTDWNDKDPIYRQLYDRLVAMILDGSIDEGDGLPSVRQVAAEERINPITVSRAFQMLADAGIVEKRRGLGMFVLAGARDRLLVAEQERFLAEEWPLTLRKIETLGLSLATLMEHQS